MKHTIEKTDDGFTCTICTWTWKSRPHSACPGVIRYQWQAAPEHLRTEGQLRKKHLHHGPIRGVVGDWYLYDVGEATPWTPEELAAEKKRNLRKCTICGREIDKARYSNEYDCCRTKKCLTAAIEKEATKLKQRREALEREFQEFLVSSRDEAILWARGLLARSNWVILDTETTGLDAWSDEIVSITIIDSNGAILLNSLIKPLQEIPADATGIHGITNEMVADAPCFADVFPKIFSELLGNTVIAYNAEFDHSMLTGSCTRNHIPLVGSLWIELKEWECAMLEYAAYVGDWHPYWKSFTWQPLPRAIHNSMGDCLATLELIKRMASSKLSTESDPVSVDIPLEILK